MGSNQLRTRAVAALLPFLVAAAPAPGTGARAIDDERAARTKEGLESNDALLAVGGYSRARLLTEHVPVPGAEQKLDEDVAAHARSPLVRADASFALLLRAARAGDVDGARKRADELGFVPEVRAVGPFSNTGGASFGQTLPDPVTTQIARVSGVERDVGWQTVPLDPDASFDLLPRMAPTKETRALVAFVVHARAPTPAALRIGSSGQVRASVNGVEVARADADRALGFDQTVAGVQLVRGDNLVVLEMGFLGDDAGLRLRFTRPDGAPITGLKFLADPRDIARAGKTKASARSGPGVVDPAARAAALIGGASASTPAKDLRAAVDVESHLHAGDLRRRPQEIEQGLTELAAALDHEKAPAADIAAVRARLANVLRPRDVTNARREYERALDLDADCVDALVGLAAVRVQLDDIAEARSLLVRAQKAAPQSDLVARRLLDFDRNDGHGGLAVDLAVLERAKAVPTEANLELAADVLEDHGDRAGALALLQGTGDAARKNRLQSDLAYARLPEDRGALEERLALAQASLRQRPGSHAEAETVALALVGDGKLADAKAFAAERAAEFPERAEPRALAAKVALIAGDRDAARASLQAALAVRPQDAELARTLRALTENREELVEKYGLDPAKYRKVPVSKEGERLGAEVLATTTAIRFFENGLGRTVTDRVIRVLDAKKAAGLQSFSFGYSEGRETLEILVAERITKRGRREPAMRVIDNGPGGKRSGVYTDVASKTVVLGKLADGDLIHVRTRKELVGMQNLFGDFFGDFEPIQGTVPVSNWRLVVEAPLSRKLAWGGRNAPAPRITEERDRRVYDFTVASAPAIEPEPGMAPFYEVADFVSVSTYASWDALDAWYEKLIAPQFELDDDLKRVAADIRSSSETETEKVRKVYDHVVTGTRYVGIELGIHGWKPYPVAEIHRRKYGDCKDKASLLVALLRAVGVPANIVLVRTANLGNIVPDPPSMWTFNHAIAYVPSLHLFLDGTAEMSGFTETPPLDQGALAFIVGKHGDKPTGEIVTIPVKPASENLNVSDYVLHLGLDGTLTLKGTEKFRGSHNAEQRRDMADPATRAELLEKHLADVMPGAHVQKLEVSDLGLDREETQYTFEATLPERAVKESDGSLSMAVSLYPHDLSGSYAQQSTRKTDIFLDHPWRTRNVMRYVLPKGARVDDLPKGGTVKGKHLAFTQKITRTADGFIVDEDTAVLDRRIPASDYVAFRDACLRADALMKRTLRIEVSR